MQVSDNNDKEEASYSFSFHLTCNQWLSDYSEFQNKMRFLHKSNEKKYQKIL